MQGDLHRRKYGSALAAAAAIVRDGPARLMHGVGWRTLNITATVFIANEFCRRVPPALRHASAALGALLGRQL